MFAEFHPNTFYSPVFWRLLKLKFKTIFGYSLSTNAINLDWPLIDWLWQAVDVIGKAGTPKTIAGSHTHTTPVLLSFGERAELATDEYIPLSPVMEGFVILKKNEDSVMASVI